MDFSKIFQVPLLPLTAPLAEQPDGLKLPMYTHQKRALQRMIEIERDKPTVTIDKRVWHPRGGILCDEVGAGKTIETLSLCLARPLDPSSGHSSSSCNGGDRGMASKCNVIVTPAHLFEQWRAEIAKFLDSQFKVLHVKDHTDPLLRNVAAWKQVDFVVITLEAVLRSVAYDKYMNEAGRAPVWNLRFARLIIDECHDSIEDNPDHLPGRIHSSVDETSAATLALTGLDCQSCWCITATPFKLGDSSVRGIMKILHIHVRLRVSMNPFNNSKTVLPPSNPFEIFKRALCVKNPPRSSELAQGTAAGAGGGGDPPPIRTSVHVETLKFASAIERAFYEEEARQVFSLNAFHSQFDALRQLCCHPMSSTKFRDRLKELAASGGKVNGAQQNPCLSLESARESMVLSKKKEAEDLKGRIANNEYLIKIIFNTLALIKELRPKDSSIDTATVGLTSPLSFDPLIPCRMRVPNSGNGYYEKRVRVSDSQIRSMSTETLRHWVRLNTELVPSNRQQNADLEKKIKEVKREAEYFDGLEERLTGGGEGSESAKEREGKGKDRTADCMICLETGLRRIAVLTGSGDVTGCGHFACEKCMRIWIHNHPTCPTCRQPVAEDNKEGTGKQCYKVVDLGAKKDEEEEKMLPVPPDVRRYGSKPAAVLRSVKKVLEEDPTNQVLIFSTYDGSLELLARALRNEKIACLIITAQTGKDEAQRRREAEIRKQAQQEMAAEAAAAARASGGGQQLLLDGYAQADAERDDERQAAGRAKGRGGKAQQQAAAAAAAQQKAPKPELGPDGVPLSLSVGERFEKFKNPQDPTRVLLLHSQDVGAGGNLQVANYVMFLEPAGNNLGAAVDLETQCIGRAARIGQTREVHVQYFVMKDTVEEQIFKAVQEGRRRKERTLQRQLAAQAEAQGRVAAEAAAGWGEGNLQGGESDPRGVSALSSSSSSSSGGVGDAALLGFSACAASDMSTSASRGSASVPAGGRSLVSSERSVPVSASAGVSLRAEMREADQGEVPGPIAEDVDMGGGEPEAEGVFEGQSQQSSAASALGQGGWEGRGMGGERDVPTEGSAGSPGASPQMPSVGGGRDNPLGAPACPICSQIFPPGTSNRSVNEHVDLCLNGQCLQIVD
uniref:RING-type domain-containing protein n=1 Tax=Chromera velia CCMP2878 TaxID=1169474 RepID=A0A0G4I5E6_9ALVE|eukprot:Cvel_11129.t1-p1 / transcript=Cvel_11129.t1 / gene=Cvel_11129 / organism=Chromera_velia_CCMP2878 / gene_product=Transcription termination factor 2, putative / transcript_product=Transcription termination factor 2, putative / location=Cvel_scaffold689:56856-62721(+) / protein_length=1124 / sequence_SO=supercontig / SO=protein_coding / is_pseudo=false